MAKRLAIGWFPAGEFEKALALWPDLVAGWNVSGFVGYCRAFDRHLRELELPPEAEVLLAPIKVKHFLRWCKREGVDAGAADSRTSYAMETATRGRVRRWPPPPGAGCWCGRDEAYETCCGRP